MCKEKLYVVKIGGNVIDDPVTLDSFLQEFSKIEGKKILVHGGGKLLQELAVKMNVPQKMIDGRRITDTETLQLALMVYGGSISKNIVAQLQAAGLNSIGLSGADLNCITAKKRENSDIDFGYVGDIQQDGVNTKVISFLLDNNITPVFCSITHNGKGQLLNTNADSITNAIAVSLSSMFDVQLHYFFDKKGVLGDSTNEDSIIPTIDQTMFKKLIAEKKISGGMIPKLDNAFNAIQRGVPLVVIAHSSQLKNAIQRKENIGTCLVS